MVLRSRNTVIGIMVNDSGKILIGFSERINSGNATNVSSHTWKIPQGGIDEGEIPSEAIARELIEELKYDIKLNKCDITQLEETVPYYFEDENGFPEFEVNLYPFLIKYLGDGKFDFDKEEFSDLKWIEPNEIYNLNLSIRKNAYVVILKKFNLL